MYPFPPVTFGKILSGVKIGNYVLHLEWIKCVCWSRTLIFLVLFLEISSAWCEATLSLFVPICLVSRCFRFFFCGSLDFFGSFSMFLFPRLGTVLVLFSKTLAQNKGKVLAEERFVKCLVEVVFLQYHFKISKSGDCVCKD